MGEWGVQRKEGQTHIDHVELSACLEEGKESIGRSCQKWQFLLTSKLPQLATICLMAEVAKNGNFYWPQSCRKWQLLALWQKFPKLAINGGILLPKMAINRMICNSIENLSHFFAISGKILHFISNNAVQKLPKMAIFIDLKVAKNGKRTYLDTYKW